MKLDKSNLHQYQNQVINEMMQKPEFMCWMGLGLGKSITTLTAFSYLKQMGLSKSMLVIAPLRVAQLVWRQEGAKWEHIKHLSFSLVCGSAAKRERALFSKADIYLINYESMSWLAMVLEHFFIKQGMPLPFDTLVFDEVSKVKRSVSKRFEAFKPILPHFKRRIGLTASPCSNGLHDLFGQFYSLDLGKRLGEHYPTFQSQFFKQINCGQFSKFEPYGDSKQMIVNRISDITIEMKADDHLDMPLFKVIDIEIDLPVKKMKAYKKLERDFFIELDNGAEIEVFNKASLSNKLLQYSNGLLYNYPDPTNMELQEIEHIHDEKYKALDELISDSGDEPILLAYSFQSERNKILKTYPDAECLTGVKEEQAVDIMTRFNTGKIKLLIAHPLCLHGDTEVLTENRGWVKITDTSKNERVFDGIEFVSHDGCSYSGYKEVIDVMGVLMTPGHKLWINNKWEKGKDVNANKNIRKKARYCYKGNDKYLIRMCEMRNHIQTSESQQNRETNKKADVYDLVNCGKRNRFLIRNNKGEMFISKNSAGHGLNLQEKCHIVVWFGLNYNLELYEQFTGRIFRQGQQHPVQCFRIICRDTMDIAVMTALEDKNRTQQSMRNAIGRYRNNLT